MKDGEESNMKPRLRAKGQCEIGGKESRESDGFCIFDNNLLFCSAVK